MPYGHVSMLLLGEGSEATEPYNKYEPLQINQVPCILAVGGTTIRTYDISYTRHLVQKPKPDISYKNQNQTFRTKAKPDISYKNETRHFVQK